MTARDFCYWLQGYLEIADKSGNPKNTIMTAGQVECIQNHLNLVFKHEIDPTFGGPEAQQKLNQIHGGQQQSMNSTSMARC